MPPLATLYKIKYCMGDFHACARYCVGQALGARQVPPELLPGDMDQAKDIILAS